MELYFANTGDKESASKLFQWRNDSIVIRMSRSQKAVTWSEHLSWYQMHASTQSMLLAKIKNTLVGQLRWTRTQDNIHSVAIELSIIVSPSHRGCGLGHQILKKGLIRLQQQMKKCNSREKKETDITLWAQVHHNNTASLAIFRKNGFQTFSGRKKRPTLETEWTFLYLSLEKVGET